MLRDMKADAIGEMVTSCTESVEIRRDAPGSYAQGHAAGIAYTKAVMLRWLQGYFGKGFDECSSCGAVGLGKSVTDEAGEPRFLCTDCAAWGSGVDCWQCGQGGADRNPDGPYKYRDRDHGKPICGHCALAQGVA